MNFLENDLEEILYSAPPAELRKRGLKIFSYDIIFRQANLGGYGIADLITVKRVRDRILITIYELKQDQIGQATFLQALGYQKAVSVYLRDKTDLSNHPVDYEIALIGKKVQTDTNFCFLPDLFPQLHLFTYSYSFDGITFQGHAGFHQTEPNFPSRLQNDLNAASKSVARLMEPPTNNDDLPF